MHHSNDKDLDVSDDHLVLQQVMEEHGIEAKRLASRTGRGKSTIYKYMVGEATIPSVIWRTLYELTRDIRIANLFFGSVPSVLVEMPVSAGRMDAPTIQSICDHRQKELNIERMILQILQDGRIDASDRSVIENFKHHFPEMIASAYKLFYAIEGEYQQQVGGR